MYKEAALLTSMTRIAMFAGIFILLVGSPMSDRLKVRDQKKWQHGSFILFTFLFLSYSSPLLFLPILCFSRQDKSLSLTQRVQVSFVNKGGNSIK